MNVLLYVQHLLGIGHVRRAALLAQAMIAEGDRVTVAYGGFPVPQVDFGAAKVVRLPAARVADANFAPILDADGEPIDDHWKAARAKALLNLYEDLQPDCILIETFPFGRRAFRFELHPLLDAATARRPKPLIASSVRDILVRKDDPAKETAMSDAARRWFDLVLVHGDPSIVPFADSFPFADRIDDLIFHTGYVAPSRSAEAQNEDGLDEIVVSVGGGAVGLALLETAITAARLAGARKTWRLLAGPDIAVPDFERLRGQAGDTVIVEQARKDFPALLARCALSISQAGYNTVVDVLAAKCRALLIPFAQSGESEQSQRAELIAARGWARYLPEAGLTADQLAQTVDECLATPAREIMSQVDLSGAQTSVRVLHQKFIGLGSG
ncbi:MAG: glycosyltransferase [Pseudomonadota bacterium]